MENKVMQNKTFRLFVSSTFSDFNQERRLLQTYVFPYIKQYCIDLNKGYTFQPIDLRWGVSNEAQLDQKALELCIEEVQSSKAQPHPNFLIMASDRYGWVPLPYAIKQSEFETILEQIENSEDKELLTSWYKLDLNQLPASYIISERSGEYEEYSNWEVVEIKLRNILQDAVHKTNLAHEQKEKYFTSATEHETIDGIFKYKTHTSHQEKLKKDNDSYDLIDDENIYGYIRNIKSIEDNSFYNNFKDTNNKEADEFKDRLKEAIKKDNILETTASLTNLSKDEINGSLNYTYEAIENEEDSQFVKTMIKFLQQTIDDFQAEDNYTTEQLEAYEQERFKNDELKLFIGREKPLKAIQDYINNDNNQALVIYGQSGLGKSALMAKAIEQTRKEKVFRFVGSTPSLNSSIDLLISILKEFGIEEEIKQIKDESGQEKPEDIKEFYARISSHILNIKKECVIFIDAVDQLSNEDGFIWLPSQLPSNLKIVISALEDENYQDDSQYFTSLQNKTSNLYKLEAFEDSKDLVESILKEYDRTIQPHQLTYLQDIYKDINTPLYLTIAAQEMRHWSSEDNTQDKDTNGQDLAPTQKLIINEYIENLNELYHHDKEFVKRVLSYLYLTKGLSESELIEIISTDVDFIEKLAPSTYHNNITKQLPIVIWARLHTQLKEFLKVEKQDNVDTLQFFHREFNDAILSQDDMQQTHEELILLLQKLITHYQDDEFESNRWGKIYIELISEYSINYEFKKDIYFKLEEYGSFIISLKEYINKELAEKDNCVQYKNQEQSLAFIMRINLSTKLRELLKTNDRYPQGIINISTINVLKDFLNDYQEEFNFNSWNELYIKLISEYKLQYNLIDTMNLKFKEHEKFSATINDIYMINKCNYIIERNNSNVKFIYLQILKYSSNVKYKQNKSFNMSTAFGYIYALSLHNMADFFRRQLNYIMAIEYGEKTLLVRDDMIINIEKYIGERQEDMLNEILKLKQTTMNNLVLSYTGLGQIEDAERIIQSSLKFIKEKYIGNPDFWAISYTQYLNVTAQNYIKNNNLQKSIIMQNESLGIAKLNFKNSRTREWGDKYVLTLMNISQVYFSNNQYILSKKYGHMAVNISESIFKNEEDSESLAQFLDALHSLRITYQTLEYDSEEDFIHNTNTYKILCHNIINIHSSNNIYDNRLYQTKSRLDSISSYLPNLDTKNDMNKEKCNIVLHNGLQYKEIVSPYTGRIWLDRNIGAINSMRYAGDADSFGDYYQWGRDSDGHEYEESEEFIIKDDFLPDGDWTKEDNEGLDRSLFWSDISGEGICPEGFRVPTEDELLTEVKASGWQDNIDIMNDFLKLPSAGYRSSINGKIINMGGYIWSSNDAISLTFITSKIYTYKYKRIDGVPIRCIKDNCEEITLEEELLVKKRYSETFDTLLNIAKLIAILDSSKEITLQILYRSLEYIELSEKLRDIFIHVFDEDTIVNLDEVAVNKESLQFILLLPSIPYSRDIDGLINQLKEFFGDEKILNIRK
jgi:hypothetical protein